MRELLSDDYSTARAYFFSVTGILFLESLLYLPLYLRVVLNRQGRPFIKSSSARHNALHVHIHRLFTLPSPFPSFITTHDLPNLLRLAVFIGLNILWGWHRLRFSSDYRHYGWLALANAGLGLLFAARNNLFSSVARIPSATLLMYHRWCGRATLVHCTIHFAGQLHHWIRTKQLTHTLANQRNQVGIMAWVSLSIIGITSISFVRRRKFELFYYSHALFLAFIIGALTHASHGPEFLVPGLALWAIDRLIRFVYSFQRIQVTSVEAYEGDVTKFKVRGLRTFHPGQIVWIQIPQVSFLNWHPFTVASAPGEDEHTIAIRGIGNYTKKTHGLVKSIQGVGGEDGGAVTPFKMRMDGSYGVGRTEWGVHPVTILVAGGIGITPGISIASHILKRAGQRNARIEGNNSEWHIHLLWVVRDESHVDWFREELSQLQSLASSPSVPATFDVTIHVTGRSLGAGYEGTRTKRPRVKEESLGTVIPGRPDISEWFQDISRRHDAFHAAVSACGPRTLIRSVRKAAARVSGEKVLFSVDEEVFGF